MKLAAILLVAVMAFPLFGAAYAHIDGCHIWHSCPSDTGSYQCGDKMRLLIL